MATVIIDGNEIEIGDDERLNGIQAARRAGVDIPHYCWHQGLSVVASCRMCLVETGQRNPETGEVSMMPRVVPACQTPASDNSVFVTNSDKVKEARAMVEEDLLIRHPIDCPICDKAGECHLQDYHFEHGRAERRADIKPFTSRRRPMGDTVTLFVDRCVMCTRCVRFTREITGTSELMVVNRGANEEIDVFPGYPLNNKLSGNVVDLCPVGALGDTDFLYSQRVWFMKKHDHVCAGCSTGCSITVEENQDKIYRLKPRENEHINHWWMCDEGRYGFKHVHDSARLTEPRILGEEGYENIEWSEVPQFVERELRKAGRVAEIISPHLTVEEAFMLCSYIRQIDEQATLILGPIPTVGEDESFPNGFTIHAEKCPNLRGVEAVLNKFSPTLTTFDTFIEQFDLYSPNTVWVTGGYKSDWISAEAAQTLASKNTLIVQDIFSSPVWKLATVQLPGAAFAERQGSYVNCNDQLQSFDWAVRSPAGVMVEGQLYWRMLGRSGLYNAKSMLTEIAREIPYFSAASGGVPNLGVDLKINQLA
ncbi:MAG: 2Fe-2S iron-sulfur cluster binding domain-containing protein [Planctomycetales bacterium]|nr:2Fe-2S iron-sulfur cluster binding domain-containing protein [Planctomycetales bacterium]